MTSSIRVGGALSRREERYGRANAFERVVLDEEERMQAQRLRARMDAVRSLAASKPSPSKSGGKAAGQLLFDSKGQVIGMANPKDIEEFDAKTVPVFSKSGELLGTVDKAKIQQVDTGDPKDASAQTQAQPVPQAPAQPAAVVASGRAYSQDMTLHGETKVAAVYGERQKAESWTSKPFPSKSDDCCGKGRRA